jgi:hypothetical protein
MINSTLRPIDRFLEDNSLNYRHLALEAARGNTLPLVEIGGDVFVARSDGQRFTDRLALRAIGTAAGISAGDM